MKQSKTVRYLLEYALILVLFYAIRLLPFNTRIKVGGAILAPIISRSRYYRARIEKNLKLIFPEMTEDQHKKIRLDVGKTFGRTFAEILNNDTYAQQQHLFHASGPGLDALADAQSEGRGAILVTGHFGQSGAARIYLGNKGIEVGAVYRPSNNTYFDRIYLKQIASAGKDLFPTGRRGTMNLVRHVKGGGVVLVLLDQKYRRGSKLDFLGRKAKTSTSIAEIALKYDLPLIPVYGIRHEDSLDIDIDFEAPIPHSDSTTMTQLANDSLSAKVREHPGQWYWMHQRWKL